MLLFSVKELGQCFDGKNIFQEVSFAIQTGEIVALSGYENDGIVSIRRHLFFLPVANP